MVTHHSTNRTQQRVTLIDVLGCQSTRHITDSS